MYERVLIPTDGSEGTERAIQHGVDIASQFGATVHALHVVDMGPTSALDINLERVMDAMEKRGVEATGAVKEAAEAAGLDVVTAMSRGTPGEAILEYVDENDIDLVVMGTHGRRGVSRAIIGSVTDRVIRRADVPVLAVRMTE